MRKLVLELEPKIGDIVYIYEPIEKYKNEAIVPIDEEQMILNPVQILRGQYFDSQFHRKSNFWYWKSMLTGKVECGYGGFYRIEKEKEISK